MQAPCGIPNGITSMEGWKELFYNHDQTPWINTRE